MDFRSDSVEAIARSVRTRDISATEVTNHALDAIEKLNPILNAFVAVDAESARFQARVIDDRIAAGEDCGPLAGVPIGVKDLEDAAGFITTYGSRLHANDRPAVVDSVLVSRLRAAGCVVIGKTNTPEYGHKGDTTNALFGATANPWDIQRSPGGSSGGSAAAIASGMVPLATGSDGGGSIRIPAALCGLSGIKTSQGRVPNGGAKAPGTWHLSVKGPMARTMSDTLLALDAVVGPDPTDMTSLPRTDIPLGDEVTHTRLPERVLWCPTMGYGEVDDAVLGACEAALRVLESMGVDVIPIDSVFDEDPVKLWLPLWASARYRAQGHLIGTDDWDELSDSIQPQVAIGSKLTADDLARSLDACYELSHKLTSALAEAPFLLCPTAAGQAPAVGSSTGYLNGRPDMGWVKFTYAMNMTQHPAASVSAGILSDAMPVGLQIIGRQLDDAGVIRLAMDLEEAIGIDETPAYS